MDRPGSKEGKITIDFGNTKITNETKKDIIRHSDNQEIWVTTMVIKGSGFTMGFVKITKDNDDITTILPDT